MARPAEPQPLEIAVTGMACRFPGAGDLDAFWRNLVEARDCISRFSPEELAAEGLPASLLDDPMYVPAKGVLSSAECFDAGFFGIAARDAARMDPQQRVFLECAWHALEDAGVDPARQDGSIGVFAGVRMNTYGLRLLADGGEAVDPESLDFIVYQDKDFVASRVSFHLGLDGPSLAIQSACSSSLAAIVTAAQSIAAGQCEMAIAGGVRVSVPLRAGYSRTPRGVLSSDGLCRPFDAAAKGTVFSDGVGTVVLKRLDDAIQDGDRIYAVLRGASLNNDGAAKMSFTAPSARGQAAAIRRALRQARLDPAAVELVECHGTGTLLGDTVELEGLIEAFGGAGASAPWCRVGSVKANIGHTSAASGVAGFIKAALAIYHGYKPPQANFDRPSPYVALERTPFMVEAEGAPWTAAGRAAAVSSFGFGGTNGHAILSSAPPSGKVESPGKVCCAVLLSARSQAALDRLEEEVLGLIGAVDATDLPHLATFTQTRRSALPLRRAIILDPAAPPEQRVTAIHAGAAGAGAGALLIDRQALSEREKSLWFEGSAAFRETLESAGVRGGSWAEAKAELESSVGMAGMMETIALTHALHELGLRPAALALPGGAVTESRVLCGELSLAEALAQEAAPSGPESELLLHLPSRSPDGKGGKWVRARRDPDCRCTSYAGAVGGALRASGAGEDVLVRALAILWCEGIAVDWGGRSPVPPSVIDPFPKYPFARTRHWALSAPRPTPEEDTREAAE